MEILVIEDDRRITDLLRRGLENEGHRVFAAADGREGLDFAQARAYDAIVLDIMLPKVDGIEVAGRLRKGGNRTPILMLTAKDAPRDVVRGLDTGADDYLTKPFSFEELLARLRAISRRGPAARSPILRVDDLILNPASHEVRRGDQSVSLTPRQYQVLELLMRQGIPFAAWAAPSDGTTGWPAASRIRMRLPSGTPAAYSINSSRSS